MKNNYETYFVETAPSLHNIRLQMTPNVLWLDDSKDILGSVTVNQLLYAMAQTGAITKGEYNKICRRKEAVAQRRK